MGVNETPVSSFSVANQDHFDVTTSGTFFVSADQGVLANDVVDQGLAAAAILVEETRHGTIELAPDGSFTYTPDPDFRGTDQFRYRIPGSESDQGVVTLEVNAITTPGDANYDGVFDSADLVQVFQAGQYEDMFTGNSSWETGDWNGDGEFDSSDLVVAFQSGTYSSAAVAAHGATLWFRSLRSLKCLPLSLDE